MINHFIVVLALLLCVFAHVGVHLADAMRPALQTSGSFAINIQPSLGTLGEEGDAIAEKKVAASERKSCRVGKVAFKNGERVLTKRPHEVGRCKLTLRA